MHNTHLHIYILYNNSHSSLDSVHIVIVPMEMLACSCPLGLVISVRHVYVHVYISLFLLSTDYQRKKEVIAHQLITEDLFLLEPWPGVP